MSTRGSTQPPTKATKLGQAAAIIGVFLLLVLGGAVYISGCTNDDTGTDLGLVEPGCRPPEACWKVGLDCGCKRSQVFGDDTHVDTIGGYGGCRTCNPMPTPGPNAQVITCLCDGADGGTAPGLCMDAPEVCVGRAPTTCDGIGARCLPVGSSCATSGGDPPDRVGTGVGGTIEQRCAFVDDVCCPGVIATDGGADQAGAIDLAGDAS